VSTAPAMFDPQSHTNTPIRKFSVGNFFLLLFAATRL
jgi:hypothetical protein